MYVDASEQTKVDNNIRIKKFRDEYMDEIYNCMQCGYCLPSCPTYEITAKESASPRGRIALMKAYADGKLEMNKQLENALYFCLGCRACESACPAGVKYGHLLEGVRESIEGTKRDQHQNHWIRKTIFDHTFNNTKRIRFAGKMLYYAQASGLQKLANQTGMVKVLPKSLANMQQAVEPVASPKDRKKRTEVMKAIGTAKAKVWLTTGCVMDMMFFETNQNTAKILNKLGFEVHFYANEQCCGAMHAHSGEKATALELAKKNIEIFENSQVDYILSNAGGCGTAFKEYGYWFQHDKVWKERAEQFSSKVRDMNEFLYDMRDILNFQSFPKKVTFQNSCHLAHGQKITLEPRTLIQMIPDIQWIELDANDSCCGSAGIYGVTNFDTSMVILDKKFTKIKKMQVDYIVVTNPPCLIQMKLGVKRAGLEQQVKVIHIIDLLHMVMKNSVKTNCNLE